MRARASLRIHLEATAPTNTTSTPFPLLVCAPLSQLYSYRDDIRSIGKLRGADAAVPACRSRTFVCVRCSHHRTRATRTFAKALPRPAACGEWSTSAGTLCAALPYSSSRRQKIHPGYREVKNGGASFSFVASSLPRRALTNICGAISILLPDLR